MWWTFYWPWWNMRTWSLPMAKIRRLLRWSVTKCGPRLVAVFVSTQRLWKTESLIWRLLLNDDNIKVYKKHGVSSVFVCFVWCEEWWISTFCDALLATYDMAAWDISWMYQCILLPLHEHIFCHMLWQWMNFQGEKRSAELVNVGYRTMGDTQIKW